MVALDANNNPVFGYSGTANLSFTVSLSQPAPAGGVSFDIATSNGSASAPSDYIARSLTAQTIAAGASSYTFDVVINGDTLAEPDETFLVTLSNPVNAAISRAQARVASRCRSGVEFHQ